MMITENTGCKINLFLKVTGRRPDGYHTISSCFWYLESPTDTVSIELESGSAGISLECTGFPIAGEGENIALTAARRYAEAAGIAPEWRITLRKTIPVAAGLGGGSADAGCVLRMLEKHFRAAGEEKLRAIALSIGADVPFFLDPRPVLATGVGEEFIYPECGISKLPVVLAAPGFPVSAKWAYTHLAPENIGAADPEAEAAFTAALAAGDISGIAAGVNNDLAAALWHKFPQLELIRREMLAAGALTATVSGSGPTIFAVAADEAGRKAVADRLREIFAGDEVMRIFEV